MKMEILLVITVLPNTKLRNQLIETNIQVKLLKNYLKGETILQERRLLLFIVKIVCIFRNEFSDEVQSLRLLQTNVDVRKRGQAALHTSVENAQLKYYQ